MNEQQLRSWLKKQYPTSSSWAAKVDRMPYEQVVAVYIRMQAEEPKEVVEISPDQLTLF